MSAQLKLEGLRIAYARLFSGEAGTHDVAIVMDDLTKFCRGFETIFHPDQRVQDLLTGRQEVFSRIVKYANLDPQSLYIETLRRKTTDVRQSD